MNFAFFLLTKFEEILQSQVLPSFFLPGIPEIFTETDVESQFDTTSKQISQDHISIMISFHSRNNISNWKLKKYFDLF
jgi:hypothetical protein